MKSSVTVILSIFLLLLAASSNAVAHQSGNKNGHHRHPHTSGDANGVVWQQKNYGQGFRQGRSVDGPYGSIVIWSPAPHNSRGLSYSSGSRPHVRNIPNQAEINAQVNRQNDQVKNYGKTYKKDYGK